RAISAPSAAGGAKRLAPACPVSLARLKRPGEHPLARQKRPPTQAEALLRALRRVVRAARRVRQGRRERLVIPNHPTLRVVRPGELRRKESGRPPRLPRRGNRAFASRRARCCAFPTLHRLRPHIAVVTQAKAQALHPARAKSLCRPILFPAG